MIVRAEHGLVGCLERQPVLVAGCRTTWGPFHTRIRSMRVDNLARCDGC
jgi:hypothetical protein